MAASTQLSSEVSRRYAMAVLDLAEEKKALPAVEEDLKTLLGWLESSEDLRLVFHSPALSAQQQITALRPLLDKAGFHKLSAHFLFVLAQNRRLSAIRAVLKAVWRALDERRGRITVHVQTAQAMSTAQEKDLTALMSERLGRDVSIDAQVRPEILGGMIVTIGSRMIDDSVSRKLERLRARMGGSANQNQSALVEAV